VGADVGLLRASGVLVAAGAPVAVLAGPVVGTLVGLSVFSTASSASTGGLVNAAVVNDAIVHATSAEHTTALRCARQTCRIPRSMLIV
jgi:hypothetical protein